MIQDQDNRSNIITHTNSTVDKCENHLPLRAGIINGYLKETFPVWTIIPTLAKNKIF